MTSPDDLPADVREALQRGDIFEAVKRLRRARGVSLNSARRVVEALASQVAVQTARPPSSGAARVSAHAAPHAPPRQPQATPGARPPDPKRAPGEVPRSRDSIWAWIVVALVLVLVYRMLR